MNSGPYSICFNNGMSERCNAECEQFLAGFCDVWDEVIDGSDATQIESLLAESMGALKYAVYKSQAHIVLNEIEVIGEYLGYDVGQI